MIHCIYTGLNCLICPVFHTFTQEPLGQICFHFPFAFVFQLLHMSSTLLPYCFLCSLGIIIFLCNLQITNALVMDKRLFTPLNILCQYIMSSSECVLEKAPIKRLPGFVHPLHFDFGDKNVLEVQSFLLEKKNRLDNDHSGKKRNHSGSRNHNNYNNNTMQ